MDKYKIVNHSGEREVFFSALVFDFDEYGRLLWEHQGTHEPSENLFFPKGSSRANGAIRKYDTWTIEVRIIHLKGKRKISDDLRKIRIQANEDDPKQDITKWNFYLNYYPFEELESQLSSLNDLKEHFTLIRAFELNWPPEHENFKNKMLDICFGKNQGYLLPFIEVEEKIFLNENERRIFIEKLRLTGIFQWFKIKYQHTYNDWGLQKETFEGSKRGGLITQDDFTDLLPTLKKLFPEKFFDEQDLKLNKVLTEMVKNQAKPSPEQLEKWLDLQISNIRRKKKLEEHDLYEFKQVNKLFEELSNYKRYGIENARGAVVVAMIVKDVRLHDVKKINNLISSASVHFKVKKK